MVYLNRYTPAKPAALFKCRKDAVGFFSFLSNFGREVQVSLVLSLVYFLIGLVLAVYGFNLFLTAWLYWRKRNETVETPELTQYPLVTIQLPMYNELYVAERLIDAAAAIEWQPDRLQIQVLDDSDDETVTLAQGRVDYWCKRGINMAYSRRTDRSGFKAGALAKGLESATGEYIAVFDADFVPAPDFLKKTISHFLPQPNLGMVQTRWGHLNTTYSVLTQAEALALDGHFVVEQTARSRNGLFFNFNGTAGVWRRACIDQAGGWQGDTLSEDLDLSYRAQMLGWKFLFLPEVVSPAELPPQIHAFKRQQFRWAKGSTQVLLKLGPRVLGDSSLPYFKRIEGLLHLSGYMMNPLVLLALIVLVPLMAINAHTPDIMFYFTFAMFGPIILYGVSQRALYPSNWLSHFRFFGILLLIGTGIALNNSIAVLEAITRRGNTFRRTPKFRVECEDDAWSAKQYALPLGWEVIGEWFLAFYAAVGVGVAWGHHLYWTLPYMALYMLSFAFVGSLSLWHARPVRSLADFKFQIAD